LRAIKERHNPIALVKGATTHSAQKDIRIVAQRALVLEDILALRRSKRKA
jgi:hypothetical protein